MTDTPLTIAYQGVLAAIRLTIATLNRVLGYDDSKPSNRQIHLHQTGGVYRIHIPESARIGGGYDCLASFRSGELDDAMNALNTMIGALRMAQWLSARTAHFSNGSQS